MFVRNTLKLLAKFPDIGRSRSLAGPNCQRLGWERFTDPRGQKFEIVERIELDDERFVVAVRYGKLVGRFAKVYQFIEAIETRELRIVSLGSYRNRFRAAEEGRIYHLDLYTADAHSTLGFFDTVPEYDVVRARAFKVFEGNSTSQETLKEFMAQLGRPLTPREKRVLRQKYGDQLN